MTHRIGEVHGDHGLECHCNHIVLRGTKIVIAYPVKGMDIHDDLAKQRGKSIEDLISVPLVDGNSKYAIQIGSNQDQVTKN